MKYEEVKNILDSVKRFAQQTKDTEVDKLLFVLSGLYGIAVSLEQTGLNSAALNAKLQEARMLNAQHPQDLEKAKMMMNQFRNVMEVLLKQEELLKQGK